MSKKPLVVLLWIAIVFEAVQTIAGFAMPVKTLEIFGLTADAGTLFLGHVIAWFLLFVSVINGLAIAAVRKNECWGWCLSYALGFWWIGIGISIFVMFGRPDNLFTDSLKGALIVIAAWKSKPKTKNCAL